MDYSKVPSPAFVLDENLLRKNLELINEVQKAAGIEIILAFKGFAMWSTFPLVKEYLSGATASSLFEARLCFEEMKSLAHVYSPVYFEHEFDELMRYSSHIVFNSFEQFNKFHAETKKVDHPISCGIRVNPEFSDVETDLYNPSAPGSRLGVGSNEFPDELPEGIEGIHFHVLCESDSFSLEKVLENLESKFGKYLHKVKWVNMGGGHLMTRKGYDHEHLIQLLKAFKQKYKVKVMTGTALCSVFPEHFELKTKEGEKQELGFDYGFICLGMRANTPIWEDLQKAFTGEDTELINIGDSLRARRIIEGVDAGRHLVLNTLERLGFFS